jgi:hypothetical protein
MPKIGTRSLIRSTAGPTCFGLLPPPEEDPADDAADQDDVPELLEDVRDQQQDPRRQR